MNITKTRKRGRPSYDDCRGVGDQIARITGGYQEGGLRVDWRKLADDQAALLVALVRKCDAADGFRLNLLTSKELARYEELVEIGSGREGMFARAREEEMLGRSVETLRRQAVRRPISRREETGIFHELAEQIAGGYLFADHVAMLSVIFVAFESGQPLGPRTRVEAGPTLVVDAAYGAVGGNLDPEGIFARWQSLVDHLVANQWLTLQRSGREMRIGLGVRATSAMDARSAAG